MHSTARSLTISLPQLPIIKGDVAKNLATHLRYITESSVLGADLVIFPELSLTGYELTLTSELAFEKGCATFQTLSQSAIANNITVVVGCPLKNGSLKNSSLENNRSKPAIGAVICFANGAIEYYAKQYLHTGEDKYCCAGEEEMLFSVAGYRIALAICADFTEPKHAQDAAKQGADLYVVSAMISASGYALDSAILSEIASTHQMPVLLSNHISKTGGWDACGKNSVWASSGKLAHSTGHRDPSLFICRLDNDIPVTIQDAKFSKS